MTPGHGNSPPVTGPGAGAGARAHLLAPLACAGALALLLASAAAFRPHQSLWVDECTQLSGLTLGPARLPAWLQGFGPYLGTPEPDRMPPLSYLMGMAWSGLVGLSEAGMRWFGIACTLLAVAFAALAARRAWGWPAAVVASLFLALSPNVLVYSVEIRAYPPFLLFASAGTWLLVEVVRRPPEARTAWTIALVAVLLLAAFTHFFGVVFAGAVLFGLLVETVLGRRRIAPVLVASVSFAAAAAVLLAPYVATAVLATRRGLARKAAAGLGDAAHGLAEPARLLYRLFGHPALILSRPVAIIGVAAFAAAVLVAAAGRRSADPVRAPLLAALGSGLSVVAAASFAARGFDPARPIYNVWALPLVALLLGRAVSVDSPAFRRLGTGAAALAIACAAWGTFQIQRRPDAFAHGPQRWILGKIAALGPERVAVIYASGSEATGHVFFPIRYTFGMRFPQYQASPDGRRLGPFGTRSPELDPSSIEARHVLVVESRRAGSSDLARLIRAGPPPFPPTSVAEHLVRAGWRLRERHALPAMVSAGVEVLDRER